MRICFVTPYSPKEITGVGKFVNELRKSLKVKGIESIVITRSATQESDVKEEMIEIKCEFLSHFKDVYLGMKTASTIFKLRREIDVLHLQTPLPQSAFSAVLGKLLKIPVITTIHGKFPPPKSFVKRLFYSFMEKITFVSTDQLVFVSTDSKEYFGGHRGDVILNGVDTAHFYPDDVIKKEMKKEMGLENSIVFLYLGRWVAHKGIYSLIDAFAEVRLKIEEGQKLVLVGSGESKQVLDKIAKLDSRDIIPVGKVGDVRKFFQMADCFVLFTSPLEGLPLALLEAMACGAVPIASEVDGIPEVVKDKENGLLLKPADFTDLVEKMIWCINNKEKLPIIGENAAKTIGEQYSLNKMTEEYISIYEHISSRT